MENNVIEFDEILGGTILSSQNIGRDMSLPSTCKPTPLQTVIILNIFRTEGGSGNNSKTIYGIHVKE